LAGIAFDKAQAACFATSFPIARPLAGLRQSRIAEAERAYREKSRPGGAPKSRRVITQDARFFLAVKVVEKGRKSE